MLLPLSGLDQTYCRQIKHIAPYLRHLPQCDGCCAVHFATVLANFPPAHDPFATSIIFPLQRSIPPESHIHRRRPQTTTPTGSAESRFQTGCQVNRCTIFASHLVVGSGRLQIIVILTGTPAGCAYSSELENSSATMRPSTDANLKGIIQSGEHLTENDAF